MLIKNLSSMRKVTQHLVSLDEGKQLIFKFKHILLHMLTYSNFDVLKDNFRKKVSVALFDHEAQKHFFKLFISTAQCVWLLNIPATQLVCGNKYDIEIEYDIFLKTLVKVLERGDHQGFLLEQDQEELRIGTTLFMSKFLVFENSQIPWEYLPSFLK